MRIISIFLGAALSSVIGAQGLATRDTFSTHLVGRYTQDDGTHHDILARRHPFRSSTIPKLKARSKTYQDSDKLLARHAEADLMAGLKKMASSALKKHGPKITKFAHEKLQEHLKKFIPAGSKEKGKSKDKDKDKGKDKKDKKEGKAEKAEKSGKEKSSFGSRDLVGGMQAFGSDLWSRREDHFENLMTLYQMAERGAALIDPERSLWDYD